jgi:hypothetical protein
MSSVVSQKKAENFVEPGSVLRVRQGHQDLDPTIEISTHQVC